MPPSLGLCTSIQQAAIALQWRFKAKLFQANHQGLKNQLTTTAGRHVEISGLIGIVVRITGCLYQTWYIHAWNFMQGLCLWHQACLQHLEIKGKCGQCIRSVERRAYHLVWELGSLETSRLFICQYQNSLHQECGKVESKLELEHLTKRVGF